jgi:hypothetical protein
MVSVYIPPDLADALREYQQNKGIEPQARRGEDPDPDRISSKTILAFLREKIHGAEGERLASDLAAELSDRVRQLEEELEQSLGKSKA